MMLVVFFSEYKNLLRVDFKSVKKWIFLVGLFTIYRIIVFTIFSDSDMLQQLKEGVGILPWQAAFTPFWEDALHGLPLAIFAIWLGKDKFWKRALIWLAVLMVAISFGLGHLYQGYFAAALLSFYVPYTFKKGQEVGFGTIMICHTIYDVATILTINTFLG